MEYWLTVVYTVAFLALLIASVALWGVLSILKRQIEEEEGGANRSGNLSNSSRPGDTTDEKSNKDIDAWGNP